MPSRIFYRLSWVVGVLVALAACRSSRTHREICFGMVSVEVMPAYAGASPASTEQEQKNIANGMRDKLGAWSSPCSGKELVTAEMRLHVRHLIQQEASGKEVLLRGRLMVKLKGERSSLGYVEEDSQTEMRAPLPPEQPDGLNNRVLEATATLANELVASYVERLSIWSMSPTQLRGFLQRPDAGDNRIEAIQVVGARRLRGEIPMLLQCLTDGDERVRDAALGALLAMRAQEAVPVLTRTREMRDAREMRKIIDAIATLGGEEAMAYLSFVAETHDDESIRGLAKRALERKGGDGVGGATPLPP